MNYSIPDHDRNILPCGPLNPCFSETANTFYGLAFLLAAVFSFVGKHPFMLGTCCSAAAGQTTSGKELELSEIEHV